MPSRRDFLTVCGRGLLLAGVASLPRHAFAQAARAAPELTELGDGLGLITGAGGNVVVLGNDAGLLLVDTGAPEAVAQIRALLDERYPAATIDTIINTHWHLEHTGGNDELAASASTIIAHENTKLWMSTKFYVDWQDRRYEPRAPQALPNTTFFSSDAQPIELDFGGEQVVYGHLEQAHTDGDIYVALPQRNLLVTGGTVSTQRYPVLDYVTGGWIGGMTQATETLLAMSDEDTRFVPAAGPAVGPGELERQRQMLMTVRERIEAIALKGKGIDDMIAAKITEEFDQRYGNPEQFIANAYHGLWWNRLRGIVA